MMLNQVLSSFGCKIHQPVSERIVGGPFNEVVVYVAASAVALGKIQRTHFTWDKMH